MPKYEYACKSCGERLEVAQSFADGPLTECPACGGHLRRVFSPPSIAFKGSGFYRTDNRKRRANPDPKADPVKADSSDSKSEPAKSEPAKSEPAAASASASETKTKTAEAKTA